MSGKVKLKNFVLITAELLHAVVVRLHECSLKLPTLWTFFDLLDGKSPVGVHVKASHVSC